MKIDGLGFGYTKCPKCGSEIVFSQKEKPYGIEVNIESEGEVYVDGMWHLVRGCQNPLCEWSQVKTHF